MSTIDDNNTIEVVPATGNDDATTIDSNKKLKLTEETKDAADDDEYPMAPDNEWPEAWIMKNNIPDDGITQCLPNRLDPPNNKNVTVAELKQLGICFWKLDSDKYMNTYPIKAVPWNPQDAVDPKLQSLRTKRNYSYADIITIHPDYLPEFDAKIKSFFEEHIHDAEEIRYIISGSGYFDVRNTMDEWVRIHIKKGDLMVLPEGIYHRFTCDENKIIHAMRLFIGQPIWTPFNRPQEDHPSRIKYVQEFVAGTTTAKTTTTTTEEKKDDP